MTLWYLPKSIDIGGVSYSINSDFRDVLDIILRLNDDSEPEWLRWRIALALFYTERIPDDHHKEAMEKLAEFISCNEKSVKPGPKLIDWEQDAQAIVSDVNKVAGKEIRELPYLHWWTFISYFHGIGEGQLSTIINIRYKRAHGRKLEKWEQEFYQKNRDKIDIKKKYSAEELAERESISKWLD